MATTGNKTPGTPNQIPGTPRDQPEPNWLSMKQVSYLITAISFIPEFFQIGYYHEMFRAGKYFNNNVNSPLVGNGIVCLLSIFYFGRSIGGMISLLYCEKKRIIQIIYWLGIPLILSMVVFSFGKGIYLQAFCSAASGFFSSFATATCMLRNETDILQVEFQKNKHVKNGGRVEDKEKYNRTNGVNEVMISLMNLACSYITVLLGALLYSSKSLSQVLVAWTMGLLILAAFVVFFLVYGFKEPQWLLITSRQDDPQKKILSERFGNAGKFIEFFFDDTSLMLQTLGVKLYEAIRHIDYIFMLVML